MPNFNDSMKTKVSPAAINTGLARPAGTGSTNDLLYTLWGGSTGSINDAGNAYFNTPDAPTALVGTAGNTTASIAFTAGSAGGSAITNYQFSTDNGSTWTTRSPVSTASPLVISGLTNGTAYQIKLRAVNAFGNGTASSAVSVTPVGASNPAFRAASSTTTITGGGGFTLTAPTGTVVGDVLIVQMSVEYDSKSGSIGTAPAGWTVRGTGDDATYPFLPWRTFSRVATGTDSFVWSGGTSWITMNAAMIAVSGATAVDVAGTRTLTAIASSVTTTTSPTLLVGLFSTFENSTAAPASMTARATVSQTNHSQVIATETLSASGATGTRTCPTSSLNVRYSQLIAVK